MRFGLGRELNRKRSNEGAGTTEKYFEATLTETGGKWQAQCLVAAGGASAEVASAEFEHRKEAARWVHEQAAAYGFVAYVLTEKRPDRARRARLARDGRSDRERSA